MYKHKYSDPHFLLYPQTTVSPTALADGLPPSFIVKIEATRRQLPSLPIPSVGGESLLLSGPVLHLACNDALFHAPPSGIIPMSVQTGLTT